VKLESIAVAEEDYCQALHAVRQPSAQSWKLRAAPSLGEFWRIKGEEAQPMLAEIYGWFTEGFDTKDLQEAKALLEELA
jgi:predicted ATPase